MKISKLKSVVSSRIFILAIAVVVVFAYFFFAVSSGRSKTYELRTGEDGNRSGDRAYMLKGDMPYFPTGNYNAEYFLREDLAYFARNYYKKYYPNPELVVKFLVTKDSVDSSGAKVINGHFSLVKDDTTILMTTLNNNRIKTSIKTGRTSANIDSELPSNSVRNQLIGTLPIEENGYSINYLGTLDKFYIGLNDGDSSATEAAAIKKLTESLKVTQLAATEYIIYRTGQGAENNTP